MKRPTLLEGVLVALGLSLLSTWTQFFARN
jgi:hypothetical protein